MAVLKVRFDEVDERDPPEWGYHGFHLTYSEPGYELRARFYDEEPDRIRILFIQDPPRRGFGDEIPYADDRLARAADELLNAVGATRLFLEGRGENGAPVEVNLRRLRRDAELS